MANEKRLIDANALIRDHGSDVTNWDKPYAVKVSSIENAPTVDAVEVVRCKDCKHCYQLIVDENGYWKNVENGGTHNLCIRNESTFDVRCDDFCSYGERKDNDF